MNIFDFDDIQNAMDRAVADKANIVKLWSRSQRID